MSLRYLCFLTTAASILHSVSAKPQDQDQDLEYIVSSMRNEYRTTTLTTPIPFATEEQTSTLATISDGRLQIMTTTFTSTWAATLTFSPNTAALSGQTGEATAQPSEDSSITSTSALPPSSSSLEISTESDKGEEVSSLSRLSLYSMKDELTSSQTQTSLSTNTTTTVFSNGTADSLVSAFPTSSTAQVAQTSRFMMPTSWEVFVVSSITWIQGVVPTSSAEPVGTPTDPSNFATTTTEPSTSDFPLQEQNSSSTIVSIPLLLLAETPVTTLNETAQTPTRTAQEVGESTSILPMKNSVIPRSVQPRGSMTWSTSPTVLPKEVVEIVVLKRRSSDGHVDRSKWLLGGLLCAIIVALQTIGV